jgi:hypothetical protein
MPQRQAANNELHRFARNRKGLKIAQTDLDIRSLGRSAGQHLWRFVDAENGRGPER